MLIGFKRGSSRLTCEQLVVLLFLLLFSSKPFADVYIGEKTIIIYGEITQSDYFTIYENQSDLAYKQVTLISTGGDVGAAIEIGRLVRQYEGRTNIGYGPALLLELDSDNVDPWALPSDALVVVGLEARLRKDDYGNRVSDLQEMRGTAICYSSCSLIWIAGVERTIYFGRLGIHRPYLATNSSDPQEVRSRYEAMTSEVEQYISDMHVDRRFYELTINTPPEEISIFDDSKIHDIVPRMDPLTAELSANANARLYGISVVEYRQRLIDADTCSDVDCRQATLWGVSTGAYARAKVKYDACRISSERASEIEKMKSSERLSNEYVRSLYDCRRAALLD